jgi:hypothetical protein
MKLNGLSAILLISLGLILCIGAVSASPDNCSADNVIALDDSNNIDVKAIDSSSNVSTTTNVKASVKKIDTEVDADDVAVIHKKKSYFKVKVKNDDTDKPVKNLKLKLKVFTKKKSKTYTIKTNSKGIAKFNTKVLGTGKHKVVVTSADEQYKVSKKAKIFVGKKHKVTLRPASSKKLKNGDTIRVSVKKEDDGDKEVEVAFKASPKHTILLKAKFYLKNKKTGKVIKKTDYAEFDDGKWDWPDEDFTCRYVPVKIKVTFINVK